MLKSNDFHPEFNKFRIPIHEVSDRGLDITLSVSPLALNELIKEPNQPFSWHANEAFSICFRLDRESEEFFKIKISVNTKLYYPCNNCLNNTPYLISIDYLLFMMPEEPEKFDIEGDDEITVSYFSNNIIDLGLILREQIFIEVPNYPKCGCPLSLTDTPCQNDLTRAFNNAVSIRENPFVRHFAKL